MAAERFVQARFSLLSSLQELLKQPKDLTKAVQQLLKDKATLSKAVAAYEAQQVQETIAHLKNNVQTRNGIQTLVAQVTLPQAAALKQVALALQQVGAPYVVILAAEVQGKPHIVVTLAEDLANTWPHNAQSIVKELAKPIKGGGGGSATFATAGGEDVAGLGEVCALAERMLQECNHAL